MTTPAKPSAPFPVPHICRFDSGEDFGIRWPKDRGKLDPTRDAWEGCDEATGPALLEWCEHAIGAIRALAPGRELEAAKALPGIVEALREITETKGRFSLDHHEHACNTIEDMKQLAVGALAALDGNKP